MDDTSVPRLPPELRLQVFSHLLRYDGELQRRTTLTAESYKTGDLQSGTEPPAVTRLRPVDSGLFVLCKALHQEVLDCFYHVNTFKIHYNQLCTCQASFRFPAFDYGRIKSLHVYDFCPRDNVRPCPMCDHAGLGLILFLSRLPKLKSVKVSFEDYIPVDDFVGAVRSQPSLSLGAPEFGTFSVLGLPVPVHLCLPLLHLAWRRLAGGHRDGDEHSRIPGGEESIRHGLEYLQFEAENWKRIPLSLRPFFLEEHQDDLVISRLRPKGLAQSDQSTIDFTLALADVVLDLFSEDGGSNSVEWEYLDGTVDVVCWDFTEACHLVD